jgi:hypothetical protein
MRGDVFNLSHPTSLNGIIRAIYFEMPSFTNLSDKQGQFHGLCHLCIAFDMKLGTVVTAVNELWLSKPESRENRWLERNF